MNDIELPLVKVKGGSFIMGATPEQLENDGMSTGDRIAHKVTLSDYYIGQFEVTQELWAAVMGSYPSNHLGNVKYPVEKVSWNTIVNEFLPELNTMTGKNFTLPTEAQWEYAARGGNKSKKYKYSGSNDLHEVGWYMGNHYYHSDTRIGGLLKPNELGIYDMSGNVYEWCNDGWEYYTTSPQTNPTGPTNSSERCFRGGFCYSDAKDCTVSKRSKQYPSSSDSKVGFRLALSL